MRKNRVRLQHIGNLYDNMQIDIKKAHENFTRNDKIVFRNSPLFLTAFLKKLGLYEKLIDSGFIRDWFDEFRNYWINCLKGRPLKLHDFFYLYFHYRTKFQSVDISEDADTKEFMRSWQHYENIYSIFGSVYKYALSPLSFFRYRKYIKNAKNVLEYGCGIAPITYSALKYAKLKKTNFTLADIKQFTYHYAKYRLAAYDNVSFIDIESESFPKFFNKFDVIFLMTVLGHLPNPLQVVKHIYLNMKDKGYLIFDYIKSTGGGLDTIQSVRERKQVLEFIEENFELIKGKIEKNNSMGTTVVRKRW